VAARVPLSLSLGSGLFKAEPIKDLREIAISIGLFNLRNVDNSLIIFRSYSWVFCFIQCPIPGSKIIFLVLDRRDYIQKEGIGKFLLTFYPDLVKRVFGRVVKNTRTIEKRIVSLYLEWVSQGNAAPILPEAILAKLGINSKQLKINNFLGNKP
jgi:hypothetical protein